MHGMIAAPSLPRKLNDLMENEEICEREKSNESSFCPNVFIFICSILHDKIVVKMYR